MSECKLHSVRFYKPKPMAIYCMAYNKCSKKLAVSRSDASIEIWNLKNTPFIEKTIASNSRNYSIEGLAWSGDRLFSVGLHALLIEYDLKKLAVKNFTSVTGQTAFCLDVNKSQTNIAVGTEQGYINIFTINDDGVAFEKFLDKQEGRILCLKYDATGNFLVTGGLDAIRIWNVKTGNAIHRMTTGRTKRKQETIVWCLAVTSDFTIITGDSRGKISFWDGNLGVAISNYTSHQADVLSLCLSEDEKTVYCSGIDSWIFSFVNVNVKDGMQKWVKCSKRVVHDHDVRALCMGDGNFLYSGGVDGYVGRSCHPPMTVVKYPPIYQRPNVVVASKTKYILLKYPDYLEVWSLGNGDERYESNESKNTFKLSKENKRLLVLQRQVNNDLGKNRNEGIITAAISPNAKWIVFSTTSALRLFKFVCDEEEENVELIPCDNLPQECGVSLNAVFTTDSNQLILSNEEGTVQVLNLKREPMLVQTIETDSFFKDAITIMECCGKYLLAADTRSNIAVWVQTDKSWRLHCKLPKYKCAPTAIRIQPATSNIVIAYSDQKILEYSLELKKTTKVIKDLEGKCDKTLNKHLSIRNIAFDPNNSNVIVLHDDSCMYVINKDP
ncbi:PREDICTED: U3 small nucleolar RNA-associated protein 4 homolog, partial [Nicrophorus vespilloides]|uniref:U3 small nucleolar RNA-associated protein 4 homolog n=1 Tax=Nicrophorus vespilloides TaxID=110193 RepID=A0ABM1MZ87_NICVS